MTAYLSPSDTTSVRMISDLDIYGQKREAEAVGQPGGQAFTLEWEVAHLVPTRMGFLEVATGTYRQQLLSYAAFPNSPLADALPGYTVFGSGLETSLTLPDKNVTLSVRYGTQHLAQWVEKSHVAMFALSWTW